MDRNEIIKRSMSIEGWFSESHANALYNLAEKYIDEGGIVLEVGSWKGRSSYILAAICKEKKAHLICMDSFAGLLVPKHVKWGLYMKKGGYYIEAVKDKKFIEQIKKNLEEFDVEYMKGDSKKLYKKVKDDSLDLCFVDGDHDSPGVDEDIKNFWLKVKKGKVFCGHDFEEGNDVAKALHDKFGPTIESVDTVWAIQK